MTELAGPALTRVRARGGGDAHLALWRDGKLFDLRPLSLDGLLSLPLAEMRSILEADASDWRPIDADAVELVAPAESQEVWAAGVTYLRSREARLEEATQKSIYEHVYASDRPELFFKAAGWRVVANGGDVGVREDSTWDVPEPELAVLSNSRAEVVAFACGNDMSSRSIEGENPLFLPQAKIYDRSCAIGPAAVLAWHVDVSRAAMRMSIEREGQTVFSATASIADMTREPEKIVGVLHSSYTLPFGAWLLTGTSIVPPDPYTAKPGDTVRVAIDGLGELVNHVSAVRHSGAEARPHRLTRT
ncbi:MAG TPA: fumarylacetoacetate hydrolase family protein [Candidatus Limnocylindria bacterium]|nr:fumarylacetoacetate hydrolase family protein [Candidatus Limnocylindria bacterium]